jgi:lipopolysaccharide/colanic/teichoic acid biosynthesis glycosyltransferase
MLSDLPSAMQTMTPPEPIALPVRPLPPRARLRPRRRPAKLLLDFIAGAMLLILCAPIILLAALLVKVTSRGPAFYTQTRLGLNGRPFSIIKLRTMRHNCEAKSGACWSKPGDPRVTLLGRILRSTHVDEMPQLINVLRGEMSLVGPRPERPEFLPELEGQLPHYRHRLAVRPGITGLAQVQLPPDTSIESVRLKLKYDIHYVKHGNAWTDLRILLATAAQALFIPSHVSNFLFRLPRGQQVEPRETANGVVEI